MSNIRSLVLHQLQLMNPEAQREFCSNVEFGCFMDHEMEKGLSTFSTCNDDIFNLNGNRDRAHQIKYRNGYLLRSRLNLCNSPDENHLYMNTTKVITLLSDLMVRFSDDNINGTAMLASFQFLAYLHHYIGSPDSDTNRMFQLYTNPGDEFQEGDELLPSQYLLLLKHTFPTRSPFMQHQIVKCLASLIESGLIDGDTKIEDTTIQYIWTIFDNINSNARWPEGSLTNAYFQYEKEAAKRLQNNVTKTDWICNLLCYCLNLGRPLSISAGERETTDYSIPVTAFVSVSYRISELYDLTRDCLNKLVSAQYLHRECGNKPWFEPLFDFRKAARRLHHSQGSDEAYRNLVSTLGIAYEQQEQTVHYILIDTLKTIVLSDLPIYIRLAAIEGTFETESGLPVEIGIWRYHLDNSRPWIQPTALEAFLDILIALDRSDPVRINVIPRLNDLSDAQTASYASQLDRIRQPHPPIDDRYLSYRNIRLSGPYSDFSALSYRDTEVVALRNALASHSKVLIHGLPGVGKTSIVREYIRINKMNYSQVIWVNAKLDIKKEYDRVASDLGLSTEDEKDKRTHVHRALTPNEWVFVFENTENAEDIPEELLALSGHVIVISRQALRSDFLSPIEIFGLTDTDADDLVTNLSRPDILQLPSYLTMRARLQGNPLGLRLLISQLSETTTDPEALLHSLCTRDHSEDTELDDLSKIILSMIDTVKSKTTRHGIAFLRLLASFLQDQDMTFFLSDSQKSLIQKLGLTIDQISTAFRLFTQYHLIEMPPANASTFTMHPLVREMIQRSISIDVIVPLLNAPLSESESILPLALDLTLSDAEVLARHRFPERIAVLLAQNILDGVAHFSKRHHRYADYCRAVQFATTVLLDNMPRLKSLIDNSNQTKLPIAKEALCPNTLGSVEWQTLLRVGRLQRMDADGRVLHDLDNAHRLFTNSRYLLEIGAPLPNTQSESESNPTKLDEWYWSYFVESKLYTFTAFNASTEVKWDSWHKLALETVEKALEKAQSEKSPIYRAQKNIECRIKKLECQSYLNLSVHSVAERLQEYEQLTTMISNLDRNAYDSAFRLQKQIGLIVFTADLIIRHPAVSESQLSDSVRLLKNGLALADQCFSGTRHLLRGELLYRLGLASLKRRSFHPPQKSFFEETDQCFTEALEEYPPGFLQLRCKLEWAKNRRTLLTFVPTLDSKYPREILEELIVDASNTPLILQEARHLAPHCPG